MNKKEPLKVGDRVSYEVLRSTWEEINKIFYEKRKGRINFISPHGKIVKLDGGEVLLARWCRRLIKKPKRKPREIWVNDYGGQIGYTMLHTSKNAADADACKSRVACIHFREVLEEKA